MSVAYTPGEIMTITAARSLDNGATCFVGIGLPSAAANLARRLHAPDLMLIYESGTLGAKPSVLPLSIGDGELAETADTVVSVPEVFAYWLGGGRVDVGFLGAAQIDRFGNLNTTVIGSYDAPDIRLPGAGGAPEIAAAAAEVFVVVPQSPRTFVAELDFVTTAGHPAPGSAGTARGRGVTRVITDLGVLAPGTGQELVLTHVHPGVRVEDARDATGWPLRVADAVAETAAPTPEELEVLRGLWADTEVAHRRP